MQLTVASSSTISSHKTKFHVTVTEASIHHVPTSHVRCTALELVVLPHKVYEPGLNSFVGSKKKAHVGLKDVHTLLNSSLIVMLSILPMLSSVMRAVIREIRSPSV